MTSTHDTHDLSITTTEHPNVARIRATFAAFSAGDLETVRASMTDGATWTAAGSSPVSGTYRGWGEISTMLGTVMELTDFTFTVDVLSVLADDAHAVAIYDATSTVQGRTAIQRWVLVDELTREGLTSATHLMAYDQAAADAHVSG